jgi:hypothetical protein
MYIMEGMARLHALCFLLRIVIEWDSTVCERYAAPRIHNSSLDWRFEWTRRMRSRWHSAIARTRTLGDSRHFSFFFPFPLSCWKLSLFAKGRRASSNINKGKSRFVYSATEDSRPQATTNHPRPYEYEHWCGRIIDNEQSFSWPLLGRKWESFRHNYRHSGSISNSWFPLLCCYIFAPLHSFDTVGSRLSHIRCTKNALNILKGGSKSPQKKEIQFSGFLHHRLVYSCICSDQLGS